AAPSQPTEAQFAARKEEKAKADDLEEDEESDSSDDDADEDDGSIDPVLAAERFNELRSRWEKVQRSLKRNGRDHATTGKQLEQMAEMFTMFKLVPRIYDELLRQVRDTLDQIRRHEREVMALAIKRGTM